MAELEAFIAAWVGGAGVISRLRELVTPQGRAWIDWLLMLQHLSRRAR